MRTIQLVFLTALAAGCSLSDDVRSHRARRSSDEVVIGLAWPLTSSTGPAKVMAGSHFWHGVEVAADIINSRRGINGRPLKLVREDEDGNVAEGKRVAQRFIDDPDLVAVIGYRDANVAMVASVMYEYASVVMVSVGANSARLTRDGFSRVFRSLPTDEVFAAALAQYCADQGMKHVLVIYENTPDGRSSANGFEARADQLQINIIDRIGNDPGATRSIASRISRRGVKPDAVFLASKQLSVAAETIAALRGEGIDAPILGATGLDSLLLLSLPGAEGTVVASVFHPDLKDEESARFVAAYRAHHNHDPDAWAAQGYDGLMLLARAMKAAQSTAPADVAKALRTREGRPSTTGASRFNERGDAVDRRIIFKRVRNGKFELLE